MSIFHNAAAHLYIVKPNSINRSFPTNLDILISALGIQQGSPALIQDVQVFSRVNPYLKLEIVRAYRKSVNTVAMTGDSINDGPALRAERPEPNASATPPVDLRNPLFSADEFRGFFKSSTFITAGGLGHFFSGCAPPRQRGLMPTL